MPPVRKITLSNRQTRRVKKDGKKKSSNLLDRIEECEKFGQFDLDISHLGIVEWPPELLILPRVRNLKAHGNKLSMLPNIASSFKQLETLNISRNHLLTLDRIEFNLLSFLKHLDISRNQLSSLPALLVKLPLLTTLLCDQNRLTSFPDNMHELRNLKVLSASNNQIAVVGDSLENVPNLEDLNLAHNPLQENAIGTRARRLHEKRKMLASKEERRALIARALNIQKRVLMREQDIVIEAMVTGQDKEYP